MVATLIKRLIQGALALLAGMIIYDVVMAYAAPGHYLFKRHRDVCILCRASRTTYTNPLYTTKPHYFPDFSNWFEKTYGPHDHVWTWSGCSRNRSNFFYGVIGCGMRHSILRFSDIEIAEFYKQVEPSDLHIFHDLLRTDEEEDGLAASRIVEQTLGYPSRP